MDAVDKILEESLKHRYDKVRSTGHDAVLLNDEKQQKLALIQKMQQTSEKELINIIAEGLQNKNPEILLEAAKRIKTLKEIEKRAEEVKEHEKQKWNAFHESEPYTIFRTFHAYYNINKTHAMDAYTKLSEKELKMLYKQVEAYNVGETPLPHLYSSLKSPLLGWLQKQITLKSQ